MDKREEQLAAIRLRIAINTRLGEMGGATSPAVGEVGMPWAEAEKLLNRHHWRADDVSALRRMAARIGLVEDAESEHWRSAGPVEDNRSQLDAQERDTL